jgi:hypothetical protein
MTELARMAELGALVTLDYSLDERGTFNLAVEQEYMGRNILTIKYHLDTSAFHI